MIRQIPVKLPWSFEVALGYPRGFRWVAFFWEPCGDEAMFDDGYCSADGNWWGFLQFTHHPSVKPWLKDYNLGSSEDKATHWLLCDLENRDIFVGERVEVKAFLVSELLKQTPGRAFIDSKVELTTEDMNDLLEKLRTELREVPAPSMAEIQERMRRDKESVEKLVADLGEIK